MNMRFVIDESSWQFDHLSQQACCEMLEQLMDQIELAQEQQHGVCYSEDLFWQAVWQNKTFYDLVSPDSEFVIPRETNERLTSLFNHLPKWQELQSYTRPTSTEIQIAGKMQNSASIAWAHLQAQSTANDTVAALILGNLHSAGSHEIECNEISNTIWLVADRVSYQDFFRWLIQISCKKPTEISQFAQSAFLQLDFHPDALPGIKNMTKPFHVLLPDLIKHFAVLSDHGKEIFSGRWQDAPAKFLPLGVNLSSENGATKSNNKAKKQRTVQYKGADVICWWHSKLEGHQNRIHFFPDNAAKTGRILIGICCEHLDT